jgi:hypothetical protein
VPLRYILAFAAVIVTTVRPFLAKQGHSDADLQGMQDAWTKAVLLQMALWAQPYVNNCEGKFSCGFSPRNPKPQTTAAPASPKRGRMKDD